MNWALDGEYGDHTFGSSNRRNRHTAASEQVPKSKLQEQNWALLAQTNTHTNTREREREAYLSSAQSVVQ